MRLMRLVVFCLLAFAGLVNAQTNFFIQDIHVNPDKSVTIAWPAVPQISYHVMFADSPNSGWQEFPDGKVTAGSNVWSLSYTDSFPHTLFMQQGFYRVRKTRLPVIMSLVLDRSGSLACPPPCGGGGGVAVSSAVSDFINLFDDTVDRVAMSSFGSTATLDVPMEQPFKSAITTAANAMVFSGRTFAEGGLMIGFNQVNNTPVPLGESITKVIVFFTDGYANTFQTNFSCRVAPINLGQDDPPFAGSTTCCGIWGFQFMDPTTGNSVACSDTTFKSIDGTTKTISSNNQNVWNEGQLHALSVANQIRSANILIYSIGVGDGLNQDFLRNVANDPAGSAYDPNQVSGEAVFASDASQLQAAFDMIATRVQYQ